MCARIVGRAAQLVRRRMWFSGAALAAAGRRLSADGEAGGLYADIVLPHYRAPGRHLFIDVAVTDPLSATALRGGSAHRAGVAAQDRVAKKHGKYSLACDMMGAGFRAGVMERYGACSDDLVGLVRGLCGEGDRDYDVEDWYFTAPSSMSYHMQRIVLAGVMGDADMIARALDMDMHDRVPASFAAAAPGRGGRGG